MIITLSRQYAAGARTIGRLLADRLGYHLLDEDLVHMVAEQLRCPEHVAAALDERSASLATRVLNQMSYWTPEAGLLTDFDNGIGPDKVERATHGVIAELAEREDLVVIGRGSRWVVGDGPDTVHVRLVAPFEVRVERTMEKEGLTRQQAEQRVREVDAQRTAYIKHYFHADVNKPEEYDLVLNTARLAPETSVQMICDAARAPVRAG